MLDNIRYVRRDHLLFNILLEEENLQSENHIVVAINIELLELLLAVYKRKSYNYKTTQQNSFRDIRKIMRHFALELKQGNRLRNHKIGSRK